MIITLYDIYESSTVYTLYTVNGMSCKPSFFFSILSSNTVYIKVYHYIFIYILYYLDNCGTHTLYSLFPYTYYNTLYIILY